MSVAAGLLVGMGVAGLLSALLALLAGSLQPWISGVALFAGAVAAVFAARSARGLALDDRPRAWDLAALVALLLVSARQFLWLTFERDGSLLALLTYNYGDLPLHWTYVEFLARGASFWPENPIFTGQRLHYPIGIDLVTALLVQVGIPLRVALSALGLLCSALLALGLYAWGRGFAVAAFLFSGGLVSIGPLADVLGHDGQSRLDWKNLYLALFIPQRGFLFALPAGLLLLWSFRERLVRDRRGLPPWVEGLLWGSLPLFHAHTFLFVSLLIATWAVARGKVRQAMLPLLIALGPAVFSTLEVTEGLRAGSIVWWKPGWTIGEHNPVLFLLANFGAYLPLAAWALARSWRRKDIEARLLLAPGLLLFVTLFFVMLAPWDWDNTKLMLWCYVLVLPALGEALRSLPAPPRAGLHVLLFYSGALSVVSAVLRPGCGAPPRGPGGRVRLRGVVRHPARRARGHRAGLQPPGRPVRARARGRLRGPPLEPRDRREGGGGAADAPHEGRARLGGIGAGAPGPLRLLGAAREHELFRCKPALARGRARGRRRLGPAIRLRSLSDSGALARARGRGRRPRGRRRRTSIGSGPHGRRDSRAARPRAARPGERARP